jgi:flagellar hook assembly protein FlgD
VCDVQGRRVRELDRAHHDAGHQRLVWDGRDRDGAPLPRGLYFVHVDAGRDRAVVKLVLLDPEGGAR